MFTTLQLLHRLTSRLASQSLDALNGGQRLQILDAANAGLADYFGYLPLHRREARRAESLPAPVTASVAATLSSKTITYPVSPWPLTGYANETAALGHSLVLAGDAQLNRLIRAGELLFPYMGASATVTATIYGDAVPFGDQDRMILDRPCWSGSGTTRILRPIEASQVPRDTVDVGTPEYFWTEPLLGYERISSPLWHLRVWPLPSALGTLTWRMESGPQELALEDFVTARELAVDPADVQDLVALCAVGLIGSDILAPHVNAGALEAAARTATTRLQGGQPQTRDTRRRRLVTPAGW